MFPTAQLKLAQGPRSIWGKCMLPVSFCRCLQQHSWTCPGPGPCLDYPVSCALTLWSKQAVLAETCQGGCRGSLHGCTWASHSQPATPALCVCNTAFSVGSREEVGLRPNQLTFPNVKNLNLTAHWVELRKSDHLAFKNPGRDSLAFLGLFTRWKNIRTLFTTRQYSHIFPPHPFSFLSQWEKK